MKCKICGSKNCKSLECEYKAILKFSFKDNKRDFKKWLELGEPRNKKGLPILVRK